MEVEHFKCNYFFEDGTKNILVGYKHLPSKIFLNKSHVNYWMAVIFKIIL